MSPNPNFIPPRLSEAIHLPGWIPGKGGIKSSKHKHREGDEKGGIVKWEKNRCILEKNREAKQVTKKALHDDEIQEIEKCTYMKEHTETVSLYAVLSQNLFCCNLHAFT